MDILFGIYTNCSVFSLAELKMSMLIEQGRWSQQEKL